MSDLWAYCPSVCDGHFCPKDCDTCQYVDVEVRTETCNGDCDNCMYSEVDP